MAAKQHQETGHIDSKFHCCIDFEWGGAVPVRSPGITGGACAYASNSVAGLQGAGGTLHRVAVGSFDKVMVVLPGSSGSFPSLIDGAELIRMVSGRAVRVLGERKGHLRGPTGKT